MAEQTARKWCICGKPEGHAGWIVCNKDRLLARVGVATGGDRMGLIERSNAEVLGDELRRLADEAEQWCRRAGESVGDREMFKRERDEAREQVRGAVGALDEFRAGLTEALNAHGVPAMPSWREAIDWLAANGGQSPSARLLAAPNVDEAESSPVTLREGRSVSEQTSTGRAMCAEETARNEQLEAERDRLARAVKDWQEIATDAHERIASLMLEEPSKTAGLYAAIDELQRENARLRKAVAEARYYVERCNLIEATDESRRWLLNNSGGQPETRVTSDEEDRT